MACVEAFEAEVEFGPAEGHVGWLSGWVVQSVVGFPLRTVSLDLVLDLGRGTVGQVAALVGWSRLGGAAWCGRRVGGGDGRLMHHRSGLHDETACLLGASRRELVPVVLLSSRRAVRRLLLWLGRPERGAGAKDKPCFLDVCKMMSGVSLFGSPTLLVCAASEGQQ